MILYVVNYVVFNFVLCVCMLGVMGKVTYTLLWTMMCIKAYCHKGWLLEQLRVGEYSSAVNLQFCTPVLVSYFKKHFAYSRLQICFLSHQ